MWRIRHVSPLKKQNKKQTIRSLCNMNCKYPWKYPCLFTLGVTCGWTIRPWGRPTGSALFQLQADHHSSRAHIPTLKWVFFHLGYTFHCARQYLNGSQATVDGIRFYWGKVMHDMKLYIYTWCKRIYCVILCLYTYVIKVYENMYVY